MFFFENVAIFGQKRGRKYVTMMHDLLSDYEISYDFVNSSGYGLAQSRERFMVVGRRWNVSDPFRFPGTVVRKKVSVRDVLSGLPEPPEDYKEHKKFANHQRTRVTDINIRRFSHVPQGGGWKDIPEDLRLPCHRKVDTEKGGVAGCVRPPRMERAVPDDHGWIR